ncbi:RAQPRD family integrative conjugative element protein [Alloalcanivorax xenomutans]|jgi:RAQPRD family integrative conjugative element protein|uniref:integrative conjugative element protein, RAQPRD family n=1 Tax=Alloalcanivorax xenomutans TaxID=1094342 RepID=UPI000E25EBE2
MWFPFPLQLRTRTLTAFTAVLILATAGGTSRVAVASDVNDAIQRRDLALLQQRLVDLQRVVDRLASRPSRHQGDADAGQPGQRVFLDVEALHRDLQVVIDGIESYLAPPRLPPRRPMPLADDYLTDDARSSTSSAPLKKERRQ